MKSCRCPETRPWRPILKVPPDPLNLQFPPRSKEWPKTFPALIKPWLGGVRAFWIHHLQAFQIFELPDLVRVDGIEPSIPEDIGGFAPVNLLGEFYEKGKSHSQILSQVVLNRPTRDLKFNVFDAELPGTDAITRASYCMNLPYQPERNTMIVQMFQVGKDTSFNQWINQWKSSLFLGALTVGYQDPWLATEYEVAEPI